ncbi:MAG: elongation factor G [Planctomycetota bacterium]|nr:elongation factor G [Planctomycetota bacterium]
MDLGRVRNIGIAAHIDAGKTTISERMLFDSGVEHRSGDVDDGTTVLDWMQEERERGITITAAATRLPWKGHAINLIDTPGHVDFTIEVERSMRVLDGAILVVDAVMGVQAQSETVWRQMKRHHVPYIAFVNKLDRPGADYMTAALNIGKRLHVRTIPVQYPILAEGGGGNANMVEGIVDLLDFTTHRFAPDARNERVSNETLPARVHDEVGVLRAELLEALSEEDDAVLRALVDGRDVPRAVASKALRARVQAGTLIPVLCGVAQKNVGIQPLLDAVVDWLPSPLDAPPIRGHVPESGAETTRSARESEPFCALAFKLQALAHGDLTFVRVYSGSIANGAQVFNPRTKQVERVARILRMHANHGEGIDVASAGDIVAFTGLKHTSTGDTLCSREAPIVLESLVAPEPVLSLVIEPADAVDRAKLVAALARLVHEDPSFHAKEDGDTGQWLIRGMGELHLEVLQHRLANEFHVQPAVGKPRVAYREALVRGASGSARVERTLGTRDIFGGVDVAVVPDASAAHAVVVWQPNAGIPSAFRCAVEDTLRLEAEVGPRFGFPLGEMRIEIIGGASDPARDAEMGFTQAASQSLRAALNDSEIALSEPWMRFEIETPGEFASGILADLNARRAELADVTQEGAFRTLSGTVALSKMFGYSTAVRSLSQGRASFSMVPIGHRVVPEGELEARGLTWR